MRIAIETFFYLEGKRGATYYIDSLLRALAGIDKDNEYLVFNFFYRQYQEKLSRIYCPQAENFRLFVKRWPERIVNKLEWGLKLPLIESWLRSEGVDVFHTLRAPSSRKVPFVIVSHDIMFVTNPEHMTDEFRWGWTHAGRPGLDLASLIVVHSEHHKREMVDVLGVDPGKIRVILSGAATDVFYPVADAARLAELKKRLGLPERFALTIGPFNRWWCRYDALLTAVQRVCASYPDFGLVMVGDDFSPESKKLKEDAQRLGIGKNVLWPGRVSAADLTTLFSLALCNVYPARDTGCSLNVLDSMSAGLPVLTSRASLLPEMLGEAGIWADPGNSEEIEAGLRRLLEDEGYRRKKGETALRLAKERTWENTARQMLSIYKELSSR